MAAHNDCGVLAPGLAACSAAVLASLGTAGAAAAGLTADANNEDAPAGASGRGILGQGKADTCDCADGLPTAQPIDAKSTRFDTLRARLAPAGWALSRTNATDGPVVFFACRWDMPRELASLDAVADFADRVGAR